MVQKPKKKATSSKASARKDSETGLSQKQIEEYREMLEEARAQIIATIEGVESEHEKDFSPIEPGDLVDLGVVNSIHEFTLNLLSADSDLLYEVEEALKRIDDGSFGICELTGDPIPQARLTAIPWTRYTLAAQQQVEREMAARDMDMDEIKDQE